MFKKPEQIKPLPAGMADAFSRTLQRQGFVAPGQQPAQAPKELAESVMSELSAALRSMSDKDFQAEYKMTKAEMRAKLKQRNESVTEAVKEYVMPEDREDMSEGSPEYMVDKDGKTVPVKPKKTYAQMKADAAKKKADAAKKKPVAEALDPVDPKTVHKPLVARKDRDIDNNGKVDDSDNYIHKRRQAIARSLAIHEDAELEEGWDDMLKAAKERNKPQPNGAGGKKQGTAYGGSKQKDAPAPKNEELHGDQHKLDKNKNGKLDKHDFKLLNKESVLDEEVKVGDKVSFDHPMTAAPGKTMKKVGTVKKIEGDTAHLKSSTKYGTLSYQKKVSELRKEEVEEVQEAAVTKQAVIDSLVKGGFNKADISKDVEKLFAQAVKSYPTANTKKIADVISSLRVNESLEVEEELKGNQHKLDKNKNGKLDKHDFKLLKKESLDELKQSIFNAYVIEAEKKIVSPFDLKNYKSQIPTKAGEKAGFDSKKVSTGTVYSRKPVKEAAYEKGMDDKKKVVVKGVKGMKSTPFTKTFRNMAAYDKWSDSDAAGDYEVHQVMNEEVELAEAPNYKLYHSTFSAAVQEAIAVAKKQGYEVDEEDWQNKVATGPKKPSKDKTNSYSIDLTKNGSPTKKKLQIQVYNMGEKYELNTYVQ
jgi:hypothetical protein